MLSQRRRQWASNTTALGQRLMLAGCHLVYVTNEYTGFVYGGHVNH